MDNNTVPGTVVTATTVSRLSVKEITTLKPPGMFEIPSNRSIFHYTRARNLFRSGNATSVELEKCMQEMILAIAFDKDNIKYYLFMSRVLMANADISSAMHMLRYALHLNPHHLESKKRLYSILILNAKELVQDAINVEPNDEEKSKHLFSLAICRFNDAQIFEKDLFDRMDPDIWTLKAIAQFSIQDYVSSVESADRALRSRHEMGDDLKTAELYILKGKILWAQGLMDAGNKQILIAAKLNPDHIEVKGFSRRTYERADRDYRKAVDLFGEGNYADALIFARSAMSVASEDIKMYVLLSKIFRLNGELQEAYGTIQKAIQIYKVRSHEDQVMLIKKAKDKQEELQRSRKHSHSVVLLEEGMEDWQQGGSYDHNASITGNDDSLDLVENIRNNFSLKIPNELTEQSHLILNEMALKYATQGEYRKAISLLSKIILAEKNLSKEEDGRQLDYRYLLNRGDCYRAQEHHEYAVNDYRDALELSPNNWLIRTRLALTLYLGATVKFNDAEFLDAERDLTAAIKQNDKVSDFYVCRGKSRYYCGKYDLAFQDYTKALELDPNNEELKRRLAQFRVDEDDKKIKKKVVPEYKEFSKHLTAPGLPFPEIERIKAASTVVDKQFYKIFKEKTDSSKSISWKMLSNAKDLARKSGQPVSQAVEEKIEKANGKNKKREMITPQSLRRRSELATKKALKNPIIGGVFTSWEDPALKALETLDLKSNKNKKKK